MIRGVHWLSRRWLIAAVSATGVFLLVSTVVAMAGMDTNIDTGNNMAKGIVLLAFVIAAVTWTGVLLHAARVLGMRLLRRLTSAE